MPTDDGFWFHQEEDVGPARPDAVQGGPEESIEGVPLRPRSFPLENSDLLSQGENLEGAVAATAEEDADGSTEGEQRFQYELPLITWRNAVPTGRGGAPVIR
jgi:hypothetical protein